MKNEERPAVGGAVFLFSMGGTAVSYCRGLGFHLLLIISHHATLYQLVVGCMENSGCYLAGFDKLLPFPSVCLKNKCVSQMLGLF